MSDYVPTRGEIISALVYYRAHCGKKPPKISQLATPVEVSQFLQEAEAGIREIERQAAEKAWDAGFLLATRNSPTQPHPLLNENPYRKEQGDE